MFRSSVFHNQPLNNWNASDANMSFAFRDLAAASSKRMLMMLWAAALIGTTLVQGRKHATAINQQPTPNPRRASCPLSVQSRVAIVLRGSAFRAGRFSPGCSERARGKQERATASLLDHVVAPLETVCGARVEVIVSMCSDSFRHLTRCAEMGRDVYAVLGRRLVALEFCVSAGQGASVRMALDLFKRRHAPMAYALIVVARHDYVYSQSITHWGAWENASLARFNFLSRCERRCAPNEVPATKDCGQFGDDPPRCVADFLYTMPGAFFGAFDRAVGKRNCFNGTEWDSGHRACGFLIPWWIDRTTNTSSESWGFLTDWRPAVRLREPSPIGFVYS